MTQTLPASVQRKVIRRIIPILMLMYTMAYLDRINIGTAALRMNAELGISQQVFGLAAGLLEGWSVQESIYFAFVSGLTIGYGDLAPKLLLSRVLAIAIGACGVLVTALVAAVAVKALNTASDGDER